MDPIDATRAPHTEGMLGNPEPGFASEEWTRRVRSLRELYRLLSEHSGMRPNMEQPYMQPAHLKTKVYLMCDFVGRTLVCPLVSRSTQSACMAYHSLKGDGSINRQQWGDVLSRSNMAASLLLDENPGMLDMMVDQTYPDQSGDRPLITDEIQGCGTQIEVRFFSAGFKPEHATIPA